jgi:alpha(1,3/1,4) fucosyltransferase
MTRNERPVVTIGFINGLDLNTFKNEILGPVADEFDLRELNSPRICVSGPYGTKRPQDGSMHIGYLCENIWPNPSSYDWCFGPWREDAVQHPRYTRITWHGFSPESLIKTPEMIAAWRSQARKFCNFFYSHRVAHRESFCQALAKYRPIDCPGNSLRNMPPIDDAASAGKWDRKRAFLSNYKFTIAFENSSAPGYHTEKILDPMLQGSIPIYWGDPTIDDFFNPHSFISVGSVMPPPSLAIDRLLRRWGRQTHRDYCPSIYNSPGDKVRRKLHRLASLSADYLIRSRGWAPLVDLVRAIDGDPDRYAAMLGEPWLKANKPLAVDRMREQWRTLLASCAA